MRRKASSSLVRNEELGVRSGGAARQNKKRRGESNMRKKSRPYRHFERSREISIAVRESACMRNFINDVFVLHLSAISYLLLSSVQERFEGFARNDDMRENDSCRFPLPSH